MTYYINRHCKRCEVAWHRPAGEETECWVCGASGTEGSNDFGMRDQSSLAGQVTLERCWASSVPGYCCPQTAVSQGVDGLGLCAFHANQIVGDVAA